MDKEYFLKGMNEFLILKILNDKDSYAYEINKIIKDKTNGYTINEGILYTLLKKLEQNKIIENYWVDNYEKKRKYYRLTNDGITYFKIMLKNYHEVLDSINNLGD